MADDIPIPNQPPLPSGALDTRYFDLSFDLFPVGAQISALESIDVELINGGTIGPGDLVIVDSPAPWISASTVDPEPVLQGMVVNWWQTATVDLETAYTITVTVSTTDGRKLPYACNQVVAMKVG